MKRIFATILFIVFTFPAHAGGADFLLGQWHSEESKTSEYWFLAGPDLILGLGFSDGGEKTFFDFLRIEKDEDGLVYVAQPRGNPPTFFTQKPTTDGSLAFVNEAHDYPQMIVYRKTDDGLSATISLINGERPRTWNYRKSD